ncbi:hypothetical protein RIF29_41950 [Crotalaria pallida]|uniref:ADP-ribosyl cyclase/cyclic ADP-ribose hydrolase n=1 Tax=Crotalaria pallida TaxID=3830 RepID=A0AAN9E6F2_CROPI
MRQKRLRRVCRSQAAPDFLGHGYYGGGTGGEDTRNNFTDHLFAAFVRKGIVAFRDDTALEKGKSISVELMQAIQASHVFIVVFSKNYATSTWCLDELAHIVDCIKNMK